MRRLLAVAVALAVALCATTDARADDVSIAELRTRLAELERTRPRGVPQGAVESIAYIVDTAERIERGFPPQARAWRQRAAAFIESARAGRDPYPLQRGKIVSRGYRSPISMRRQGYTVYIPRDYDPARAYPLMICLHGGSSNGNLFLGVVLGNNMSWLQYDRFLWDEFTPRWSPNWIVVAADGYGQLMWRWMGEQDVLDVIDDVERHYHVDEDRVVLAGLSNGGVGAYSIGTRHAWRFSVVMAMAGAPSWRQYAGGRMTREEDAVVQTMSGMHLTENIFNTDFRAYHGRADTGPMRPAFVEEFTRRVRSLGLEPQVSWYDLGHDILYPATRHGRIYESLASIHRNRRPREVRVVTGDYRAARQHWVTVTRIERFPELARVRAVAEASTITVETSNTIAFAIDLRDAPVAAGSDLRIVVDGRDAYRGPRAQLGHVVNLARAGAGWRLGFLPDPPAGIEKRPGLSGPLSDAYFDRMIHVYGTGRPEQAAALRHAAEKGARGWPLWLWTVNQQVVADRDVTPQMMQSGTLVLYGTPGSNSVLERIAGRLPIRVDQVGVLVGSRRISGSDVGVRFIYPNPLAPSRYVIVQSGPTPAAVEAGNNLPDFLPDYVVYDRASTRVRPRLTGGRNGSRAAGFFDRFWRLSAEGPSEGGDDGGVPMPRPRAERASVGGSDVSEAPSAVVPLLPVPPAPPDPAPPTTFLAPPRDPAGHVAREIARRVAAFPRFRAMIPGATWMVDPIARWSIRAQRNCMRDLRRLHVPARAVPALPTPVASPVELVGRVGGIWFRSVHEDRTILLSCEMATRLPDLTTVLARHGVRGVDVLSSYREAPRPSFHTMGMALDMSTFWTRRGGMHVTRDFLLTPAFETCRAPRPSNERARTLLEIACDIAATHRFSSVLTPNYNEGHRDHFHLDARPDDPRIFVR